MERDKLACVQAPVGRARGREVAGGGEGSVAEPVDKGCLVPCQSTHCAPDSGANFN